MIYSKKLLFIPMLILFVVLSCKKDNSLTLIFPVETIEAPYGINFQWTNNSAKPSHLQVARDEQFEKIILDTIINDDHFEYLNNMPPETMVFWKVEVEGKTEIANFETEDIVERFVGAHLSTLRISGWPSGWDTVYQVGLEMTIGPDGTMEIDLDQGDGFSISRIEDFIYYSFQPYEFFYTNPGDNPSTSKEARFYIQNDSFSFRKSFGGNGGGYHRIYTGKIE